MLIKRRKKVLGIPLDNHATSYHRVIQPLYELCNRNHLIQFLAEPENQPLQYEWADLLYIQCLYAPDAYKFYLSQKKAGKGIILDFDDDYLHIPEDSPEQTEIIDHKTGERHMVPTKLRTFYIKMFIRLADVVVVTTKTLKNLYQPLIRSKENEFKELNSGPAKIVIIPNCVSPDMERDIEKKPNPKIRILWSGSSSHLPDLELIKEPLKRIMKKYEDKVELHLQGPLDFNEFDNIPHYKHKAVEFGEYLNVIQDINPDISLGPLKENPFNNAKSNLKYLQMTLMESAFIGSNVGPYKEIDHGIDGMISKNDEEWFNNIEALILNEELRLNITQKALNYVRNNFMIEQHINKWEKIIS